MFERFTGQARHVVMQAQVERRRLRHDFIGTEHLLLALLDEGSGRAAEILHGAGVSADRIRAEIERHVGAAPGSLGTVDAEALRSIGIDLDAVRAAVEETFGEGALLAPPPGRRGLLGRWNDGSRFSGRAKKVLELSLREALRLKHRQIGAEHILLGLLREGEGLGVMILTRSGFDLDDLRRRTIESLHDRAA